MLWVSNLDYLFIEFFSSKIITIINIIIISIFNIKYMYRFKEGVCFRGNDFSCNEILYI